MRIARVLPTIAGSLSLTLGVVFGLLTFPTSCACGAEVPHPHALFLLGHHHHAAGGEAMEPSADDQSSATTDTGTRGPTVTSVSGNEDGTAFSVVLPGVDTGVPVSAGWLSRSSSITLTGRHESPEVPPPRRAPSSLASTRP